MSTSGNLARQQNYQHSPDPIPDPIQTAVLTQAKTFAVETHPRPVCGPGDVLVHLEGCGVCASNLPVWEGREWFTYPLEAGAPGHEGWGRIAQVGENIDHLQVGQRVACLGANAFAEYVAVSAQQVAVLPDTLENIPFPGEAIGCAMNIFRRADIQKDQTVAIIGAGFLGLLLVQLATHAGARVLVVSRRESVRKLALEYGATAAFDSEDWWGNAQKIVELTEGHGCERVVEVTGLQFALDMATEMIAEYGKLIIGGYHQDDLRQVNMQKWNWKAIDVINAHERDPHKYVQGMQEGIVATEQGRIQPQDLLTHCFRLDQLDNAFHIMVDRPDGFIKGWIRL